MPNVREETRAWFKGRLPGDWFVGELVVTADRDEVLLVGELKPVDLGPAASEEAIRTRATALPGRSWFWTCEAGGG